MQRANHLLETQETVSCCRAAEGCPGLVWSVIVDGGGCAAGQLLATYPWCLTFIVVE